MSELHWFFDWCGCVSENDLWIAFTGPWLRDRRQYKPSCTQKISIHPLYFIFHRLRHWVPLHYKIRKLFSHFLDSLCYLLLYMPTACSSRSLRCFSFILVCTHVTTRSVLRDPGAVLFRCTVRVLVKQFIEVPLVATAFLEKIQICPDVSLNSVILS